MFLNGLKRPTRQVELRALTFNENSVDPSPSVYWTEPRAGGFNDGQILPHASPSLVSLGMAISLTIALPTTIGNSRNPASSGVATPKPTATGRWVTFRIFSTFLATSAKSSNFAPVIPVSDT